MLEKKQESQRRGALPRLLLFTFLFAMPVYMCYQLQRGTLAQTLAVTKQASTIVKRVVKQKNDTARAAALMSLPTTFANETGDNRTGVELHASICGERSTRETCGDVIYVVDDRLPSSDNTTYIAAQWRALSHIVENFEAFNGTCIAFYDVKKDVYDARGLHQVWARIEATFAVFDDFPRASHALYMDTDSILSSSRHTPTDMFKALAVAYRNESSTSDVPPSLIVNKPFKVSPENLA